MRKFKFRLSVVERHRRLQEQEKQVQLSRALEKLRKTENKLLDLDMREVEVRREFSALGDGGDTEFLKSSEFWMLDQFIQGQKVRRVDLKEQLQVEEQNVGNAYGEFLKARQQKMIMEKLHEKNYSSYKEEFRKHEMRLLDEQYVTRNKSIKSIVQELNDGDTEEDVHE